jgi:hypothetical protein
MEDLSKKKSKNDSKKLVREWKQHLAYTRLNEREINKRAKEFARKGMKPNGH